MLSDRLPKDKSAQIIVYERGDSVLATERAVKSLEKMGYKNVKHYRGGILQWQNMHYPVNKWHTSIASWLILIRGDRFLLTVWFVHQFANMTKHDNGFPTLSENEYLPSHLYFQQSEIFLGHLSGCRIAFHGSVFCCICVGLIIFLSFFKSYSGGPITGRVAGISIDLPE